MSTATINIEQLPWPGFRIPRPRNSARRRNPQQTFQDSLAHHNAGRVAEAVAGYESYLVERPDSPEAHNNLATALAAQGRLDDAVAHYELALFLKPDYAEAASNLAVVLQSQGKVAEAMACHKRALGASPGHAGIHYNFARALTAQGSFDEAADQYRQTLALDPNHSNAHNNLGNILSARNEADEAAAHYVRAISLNPRHADAQNNLGNILRDRGRFDEALTHYNRAIEIRPVCPEAHYNRAEIKRFRQGDPDLAALEHLAGRNGLPAAEIPYIHFALAKALRDCGDYTGSFDHLRRGNDLKRAQIIYDEPVMAGFFKRIAAVFNQNLFERQAGQGKPSTVPVFIVGMPRSGSTLVEQLLAGHPRIHAAGELPHLENVLNAAVKGHQALFPECVPSLDACALREIGRSYISRLPPLGPSHLRIVDKLPHNFLYIGLIRLILPHAKIVHTMRHPLDTCVSCYSKLFTAGQRFSYNLGELGRYYRRYTELMNHWRSVLPPDAFLDVVYEDVVNDLEGEARRLIDFCGLSWDDRCLNFQGASRYIHTASAVQVRRPLFRDSLRRWREYEFGLGPLLEELKDILPAETAGADEEAKTARASM